MAIQRLVSAVLLAATVLVGSAAAQDKNNEVAGLIGRTFISNQGVPQHPYQ